MKLIIATHNKGKLREFRELLVPHFASVTSSGELGLAEPEETGKTFAENALLKARAACKASGLPALADDSGLCVAALGGEPGIHSARFAANNKGEKDFADAMRRIDESLKGKPRGAFFIAVLALQYPDGRSELFEGRVTGTLCWPPRGENGHGYDPFFIPDSYDKTFGEMSGAEKNAISHRAAAVRKLLDYLNG